LGRSSGAKGDDREQAKVGKWSPMIKPIKTCVILGLIFASPSFAQDSPLSCGISAKETFFGDIPAIECNVLDNNVTVESIVINRGNCVSPQVNDQTRDIATGAWNRLSAQQQESVSNIMMAVFAYKQLVDNGTISQDEANAISAVINDPTGRTYNFGGKFSFATRCENILEFSIVTNGQEWVWSMY
jgi:hypothetical protein